MAKILVLGASSYVGRHLYRRLGSSRTIGTYNRNILSGCAHFDARSMDLTELFKVGEFSHAVILAGDTNPDSCARDPEGSAYLNVTRMRAIVDQVRELGAMPIFLSTEAVFDGEKGQYVETDEPRPILLYGRQKLEIEEHIRSGGAGWLILRLARVIGSTPGDGTITMSWLDQIGGNQAIRCATDQIFSPVHVGDVAEAIATLIELGSAGLFHIAGPAQISRYALLAQLLDEYRRFESYEGKVTACSLSDFATLEPRPQNVSLCSKKFEAMSGFRFRDVQSCCLEAVAAWRQVHAGSSGSPAHSPFAEVK